ncbi:MAG: hypothetical protein AAGI48_13960 [Verrucomicrobiota bacterium]
MNLDGPRDCVNQIDAVKVSAMVPGEEELPEKEAAVAAPPGTYHFWFNRYGAIFLTVKADGAEVEAFQEDKTAEREMLYKARLSEKDGMFRSKDGATFILTKLDKRVVNDGNRGINSGDWKLVVEGMKEGQIPIAAFGEEEGVYFGEAVNREP